MAKFHTLGANSDIVTAGEVVPAEDADLTRAIATVGGKPIKIPEGGGGGGGSYIWLKIMNNADEYGEDVQIGEYVFSGRGNYAEPVHVYHESDLQHPVGSLLVRGNYAGTTYGGNLIPIPCPADDPRAGTVVELWIGSCLLDTTAILMADGTKKAIRDVRAGDLVMSVNPKTGALEADRVIACDGDTDKRHDVKDVWRFDDGSVIETVHRHRIYNVDLGEPMYMEAWNIGERCYKEDGATPRLVGHERQAGDWRHCTLFTERWNNYFAGGLLCGNRRSSKLNIGG